MLILLINLLIIYLSDSLNKNEFFLVFSSSEITTVISPFILSEKTSKFFISNLINSS